MMRQLSIQPTKMTTTGTSLLVRTFYAPINPSPLNYNFDAKSRVRVILAAVGLVAEGAKMSTMMSVGMERDMRKVERLALLASRQLKMVEVEKASVVLSFLLSLLFV